MKIFLGIVIVFVTVIFLVGTVSESSGKITSYPAINYRLDGPPLYCIVEPVGVETKDRDNWVGSANNAVLDWNNKIASFVPESSNPEYWEMNYKVIKVTDSRTDCSIFIEFYDEIKGSKSAFGYRTVGFFDPQVETISLFLKKIPYNETLNIIIHEVGHTIGLGHYVSDNDDENKKWRTAEKMAPSIMIPVAHVNPEFQTITELDVSRVLELYGDGGFYAFSPKLIATPPTTPEPTPIPAPKGPIRPFDSVNITEQSIVISKHESAVIKITGQINEDVFLRGNYVLIVIKTPLSDFVVHKVRPLQSGYFELPLRFDGKSPQGWYEAETSYFENIDTEMNVDFYFGFEQAKFLTEPKEIIIPSWVKKDAGWWAQNKIDDIKFVNVIEYLLSNGVIDIGDPYLNVDPAQEIPSWVKNTAGWWAKDKIDDLTFVSALEYLIKIGIIKIE